MLPHDERGPAGGPAGRGGARTPSEPQPVAPSHVLVCLDRSPLGESVLPHAIALARGCGARLTLLHVLETKRGLEAPGPVDPLEWEIGLAEGREYLEHVAAHHRSSDVPMSTALIQGHAAEQICAWAGSHRVDVTVLCTHGEGGRTEWSLASTTQKLIEGVAGSLLLVPASAAAPAGPAACYTRILVPLDGSARAESALSLAIRLARAQDTELILVHIVPVPELTRIGPLVPEDLDLERRLVGRNERVGQQYLERLQARLQQSGLTVRTVLARDADVRNELVRVVAREQADLVVMSAHGSTGRTDRPCGSVAAHLLACCGTPVLVVREAERAMGRRRDPMAERSQSRARMPALATP